MPSKKAPPAKISKADLKPIQPDFIAFADGAASGNPGPAGWGMVWIDLTQTPVWVTEKADFSDHATNNQMELQAVIAALEQAPAGARGVIYTDSQYVIKGATQWIFGWAKKGWITAEGEPVKNQDLWQQVADLVRGRKVKWEYVRGHVGILGNERADELAVAGSHGEMPGLFEGSLADYAAEKGILISESFLKGEPQVDPRANAGPKYREPVYLSLLEGQLMRHKTWKECEARVKGKPNVRFKKVASAFEEEEILKKWGIRA